MDYKLVIEEQIRELQKRQDAISGNKGYDSEACMIAEVITKLVEKVIDLKLN